MKRNKPLLVILFLLFFLPLILSACGGSGGSSGNAQDTGGGSGLNSATSVTGTVRSASGDPIAGATVYIPGTQIAASLVSASRTFDRAVTAADGTVCEDPPSADSALAAGCSAADGTFAIDTSGVSANADQIVFQKGALRMVQALECTADPCTLPGSTTTFSGAATWPKVAVVTGAFDRIEDVLAKLADPNTGDSVNGSYGRVNNETGIFVYGSEYGTNLTIIDGTGYVYVEENVDQVSYDTWASYFDGTNPLVKNGKPVFDIIFINCGNDSEYDILLSPDKAALLKSYVEAGGRLYVTDWSYDYIEQIFPQFMQFEGEADDSATSGILDDAQTGSDGVSLNATVHNTAFRNWLMTVTVNQHNATTPGNPDLDCNYDDYDPAAYDQITGALTAGGLIPIADFLGGWTHMVGAHTAESPDIWISAGDGVTFDGLADRPLTASQAMGSNNGRVVYSSYHTAHSCPTLYFWPQERVLQYLIFEAF